MSQSGYTPILIYASGTTTNVPLAANMTSSASGAELALNYADGKLFYKDSGGVVQVLATKGAGTIGGSNTQVQYNNAGALAGSANMTFNGTTLTVAGLSNTGNTTLGDASADTVTVNGTITSNLIFTDNTYDIGASGATRPRSYYGAANVTVGGYFSSVSPAATDVTSLRLTGTTTGFNRMQIVNSAGGYYVGTNSSAGGSWITGSLAYALVISAPSQNIQLSASGNSDVTLNTSGQLTVGSGGSAFQVLNAYSAAGNDGIGIQTGAGAATLVMRGVTENRIQGISAIPLTFYANNSEVGRFTAAGNFGIGTNNPGAPLELQLFSTTSPALRLRYSSTAYYGEHLMDPSGNYVIRSPAPNGVTSGLLTLQGGTGTGISLCVNGNNYTSPAAFLDVNGNLTVGNANTTYGDRIVAGVNSSVSLAATDAGISVRNASASTQIRMSRLGSTYSYLGVTGPGGMIYSYDNLFFAADTSSSMYWSTGGSLSLSLGNGGSLKLFKAYLSFNDNGYIRADISNSLALQAGASTTVGFQLRNAGNSAAMLSMYGPGGASLALEGATPQSGIGITFPATQGASSNANTLDDYEEGQFTPIDGSNVVTFTSASGYYTKIGRVVTCVVRVTYPTTVSGVTANIGGFPFNATAGYPGAYSEYSTRGVICHRAQGATGLYVTLNGGTDLTNAGCSGNEFQLTYIYFTD